MHEVGTSKHTCLAQRYSLASLVNVCLLTSNVFEKVEIQEMQVQNQHPRMQRPFLSSVVHPTKQRTVHNF